MHRRIHNNTVELTVRLKDGTSKLTEFDDWIKRESDRAGQKSPKQCNLAPSNVRAIWSG